MLIPIKSSNTEVRGEEGRDPTQYHLIQIEQMV